ncbi:MAG: MarR family transcriptional regulator [Actinobacteria bacterium]|nr:MarR family transcriptional regulator [Actinomycetota bacterium]MCA1721522.1 MarR family transcriptional regulator [Actinomycetota bacterium]
MSRPVDDLSSQLVTLVRGLRSLHVAMIEGGGVHVDPSSVALLAHLEKLGPSRLSALAGAVCLDLSTVSRQVPALERSGWVERTRDPDDARAQLVELTPEGRSVLDGVRRDRAEVLARLLPDWTDAELRHFAAQMARFNDDVNAHRPAVLPVPQLQGARA